MAEHPLSQSDFPLRRQLNIISRSLLLAGALLLSAESSRAAVIYVNAAATGSNNGTSWANAFTELVSGINTAHAGDQIWVAAGIYYPDYDPSTGTHTGNRNLQFDLESNVSYFGGFSGTETAVYQSNWAVNRTVLSGNILQTGTFANNTKGIMAWGNQSEALTGAVVQGFVFAGGNADGAEDTNDTDAGGAIYVGNGSLDVRFCTFVGNYAYYGGAIMLDYQTGPGLTIENCLFANNTSVFNGGAIMAESYGGSISISDCTFINNYGTAGSAVETNEYFSYNFVNNLIFGNTGDGMYQVAFGPGSSGTSAYNVSQQALTGSNNTTITAANFAQTPSPGPDGVWGTADDVVTAPLAYNSPAINAASAAYLPEDTTDTSGNGNTTAPIPYDLAHNPRVLYGVPDAGAYEYLDTTTVPAALSAPATGSVYGNPITVSYSLPEAALGGSVSLTFQSGSNSYVETLSSTGTSAGSYTFTFNPANPTGSGSIVSGSAIPDGVYTLTLTYQDSYGSPAASVSNSNVTIETNTPTLVLDSGTVSYTQNNPATVISPGAVASDSPDGWAGGKLSVQISAGAVTADSLAIGASTGVTVSGGSVLASGAIIGTVSASGTVAGSNTLTINLNGNATDAEVQSLVRAITYACSSGTPFAGTRTVTFTLANAAGYSATASRAITVAVDTSPPVITSGTSVSGVLNGAFSYTITAAHYPTSYFASGLPLGLTVNVFTGVISGTALQYGVSYVTIGAINSFGAGSANLTLTIPLPLPVITSGTLITAVEGTSYNYQIIASNFPTSYAAASLPAGLSMNPSTGLISGTPTAAGVFVATMSAINSTGTTSAPLTFNVSAPLPYITSAATATGTYGAPFSYSIVAQNNPTFFEAYVLPQGLFVNSNTGVISGTPMTTGSITVTLAAFNSYGSSTAALVLILNPELAPVITSSALRTLISFTGSNGAYPNGVTTGTDGNLYGTTVGGGASGDGTIFKITTSGSFATLSSFSGTNGISPEAPLALGRDGNFYGTTIYGGASGSGGYGTAFRVTPGGTLSTLYTFAGTNGRVPLSQLFQATDGNFYGTTLDGGVGGLGTVFKLTTTGTLTTLLSFNGINGAEPAGGLVQGIDGNLYGVTETGDGSPAEAGSVFRVSTSGSAATLSSFSETDGAFPAASLVQASDSNFYGTTIDGGSFGEGTLFRATAAGQITSLCSFSGTGGLDPGASPQSSLIQAGDGSLYGATVRGGNWNNGILLDLTTSGSLTTLYAFTGGADGGDVETRLVQGGDGNYYGTTDAGGVFGLGTVFQWIPGPVTAPPQVGTLITYQITAANYPTSFNATGLPPGLTLNPLSGLISGTATSAGVSNVTISALNAGGTDTATITLTVVPPPPVITSTARASGTSGCPFAYQIAATNNPFVYAASGLPGGFSVNTQTGLITGTATATGTTNVTVAASNAGGSGSASLVITVNPTSYAAWQNSRFTAAQLANPTVSGTLAAPAGDGIPNLLKYALNLNPMANGAQSLPASSMMLINGNYYLTLTYTQALWAGDISYIPEVSGDLQTWNFGPGYLAPVSITSDGDGLTETVTVQDLVPMENGQPRFIRLEITVP
jgi:uncharacterized repeat protein (TIGR03803 family)